VNSQYVFGFFSHIHSTHLILFRKFSEHVQFNSVYSADMHSKNLLEDLPQFTLSAKTDYFHIFSVYVYTYSYYVFRKCTQLNLTIWNEIMFTAFKKTLLQKRMDGELMI
jgi:hypothetical protein